MTNSPVWRAIVAAAHSIQGRAAVIEDGTFEGKVATILTLEVPCEGPYPCGVCEKGWDPARKEWGLSDLFALRQVEGWPDQRPDEKIEDGLLRIAVNEHGVMSHYDCSATIFPGAHIDSDGTITTESPRGRIMGRGRTCGLCEAGPGNVCVCF